MIPTLISSNPLTGRTDRLHVFQTLVPSFSYVGRVQVFIESHMFTSNTINPDRPFILYRRMSFLPERHVAPTYMFTYM